ncbi:modin [Paramyrothecium foliicola]|nr:modin [Paramyrothecium foliicola]
MGETHPGSARLEDKILLRSGARSDDSISWPYLLSALHKLENESTSWQTRQYDGASKDTNLPRSSSVIVQSWSRSYSSVPADVATPFALSSLSDLVAMAAQLGLCWSTFDCDNSHFYARGNGFILTGCRKSIGHCFRFERVKDSTFECHRMIPAIEAGEYCFGLVPTIFRPRDGQGDLLSADLVRNAPNIVPTLRLGSEMEILDTLAYIGCNIATQRLFRESAVAFELIGMLALPVHIRATSFRRLPNPTTHHWRGDSFDAPCALAAFKDQIAYSSSITHTEQIEEMLHFITAIESEYDAEPIGQSFRLLDQLHNALDRMDNYLISANTQLEVLTVVRNHLQAVHSHLNDGSNTFDRLDTALPHEKEAALLGIYFDTIRPSVAGLPATVPQNGATIHDPIGSLETAQPKLRGRALKGLALGIEEKLTNTWCVLMFRMICWFMLHDFNKDDVQIPKSWLYGSAVPAYIL